MLTQRLHNNPDGSSVLVIQADPAGKAELIGLADELDLRSSVTTEGTIHHLNDPAGNGPRQID
jgi:hypothetical protein